MAVKISQLSASTSITSDDFFPVVDSGSLTTKRASAQQILDYVAGSTFNTLTVTSLTSSNVTGSTAMFTSITGTHAGSGAGLTNIPNSALVNNSVTVGSTTISLGTSATTIEGIVVLTGSTVTGSTALFNNLTASVALFNGDIRVLGTASITQLNTIGQQSLVIGDKYITILSGGVDHTGINGSGILWGTSSGPGETTGALGEHAHILYDANRDALEIFPGLYVAGNTELSGNLIVSGSTTLSTLSGTTGEFTTISASNARISGSIMIGGTANLGEIADYAYVLYTSSLDKVVVYPGLYVSGNLTGSGLGAFQTVSASTYLGLPTSSGGTPGGTNTAIQFNSGSTFSGSNNLIYNYTTNTLSGTTAQFTTVTASNINVSGNLVIFGTADLTSVPNYAYVRYTSSFDKVIVYPGLYVSGNLTASNDSYFQTVSGTIAQFTTITGSTVTASTAQFITITASNDIIVNGVTVGEGAGNIVTNTVLGNAALRTNTIGIRNVAIGTSSLEANTIGSQNVAVGADTLRANISGSDNVAVGYFALTANLGTTTLGCYNVAVGSQTLRSNTSGSYNVAIGANDAAAPPPLGSNTTGNGNVAIGQMTLGSNVSGDFNVAVGREALKKNTASSNTAVGLQALLENTTGTQNCAVGAVALTTNSTGGSNSAFGRAALQLNTNGSNNTAVGLQSLNANTTGSFNTALGSQAGLNLNTGSNNLFLGYQAGLGETNLSDTVIIRANAERMRINSTGNVGIATNAPTQTLDVNGTMRLRVLVAGTNAGFGRSTINGDITALTSDQRLKKEINTITGSLDSINKLRGVTYKWDDTRFNDFIIEEREREKTQIGLIAQEVETVLPELVYNNGVEDLKAVRYAELVAVLIEGIKELSQEVNNLKTEIQTLKSGSI